MKQLPPLTVFNFLPDPHRVRGCYVIIAESLKSSHFLSCGDRIHEIPYVLELLAFIHIHFLSLNSILNPSISHFVQIHYTLPLMKQRIQFAGQ